MVAMIDPRSVATMFVVERNAAAEPLTVVVLDAAGRKASAEPGKLYRLVGIDERANPYEGEPTWEDAAWQ
jgi:hypothetical protein